MSVASLAQSVEEACVRFADRPALTHRGCTLLYRELWERVLALSWGYRALGIRPGDRIVCQLPTSPEHVVAVAAAWACGAVHVGVSKDLTPAELLGVVARVGPRAVVYAPPADTPDPLAAPRELRRVDPAITTILGGKPGGETLPLLADFLAPGAPRRTAPVPEGPEDAALLLLTSGTTGTPKAVVETLPALLGKAAFFAEATSPQCEDVHLMCLPICHAFGLKLTLMALISGGRLVMLDRFTPDAALTAIGQEGVTFLPGSPTHLTLELGALDPRRYRVDSLRWAITAAAPLPPAVIEGVYERLRTDLMFVYGCSEGFVTLTTDPDEIRRGSVGRRVYRGPEGTPPAGEVRILDPETHEDIAGGEVGEIAFGSACPVRYWDAPPVAADGWYRTGDLGWIDDAGRLFVSGRLKDVINRGGLKVAAGEVETALARLAGVAECGVVPAPDPILGEAICACVVPSTEPAPTLAELRRHLAERLAKHKLPDELCILDRIPRSPVGKIDRSALAQAAAAHVRRERFRDTRARTT